MLGGLDTLGCQCRALHPPAGQRGRAISTHFTTTPAHFWALPPGSFPVCAATSRSCSRRTVYIWNTQRAVYQSNKQNAFPHSGVPLATCQFCGAYTALLACHLSAALGHLWYTGWFLPCNNVPRLLSQKYVRVPPLPQTLLRWRSLPRFVRRRRRLCVVRTAWRHFLPPFFAACLPINWGPTPCASRRAGRSHAA